MPVAILLTLLLQFRHRCNPPAAQAVAPCSEYLLRTRLADDTGTDVAPYLDRRRRLARGSRCDTSRLLKSPHQPSQGRTMKAPGTPVRPERGDAGQCLRLEPHQSDPH